MEDCIFCKIVDGKIPSVKIWEDDRHVAILDINPSTEGATLVLTKKHFDSYAFEMPEQDYSALMLAAKKVAKLLDKGLNVKRTVMVMEGFDVNHAHIKLYPARPGYSLTKLGSPKSSEELKKVAEKITRNNK